MIRGFGIHPVLGFGPGLDQNWQIKRRCQIVEILNHASDY